MINNPEKQTRHQESQLIKAQEAANNGRRLSWNRFLAGGSLRNTSLRDRPTQKLRSRLGTSLEQRRQMADVAFEAEQNARCAELVQMFQNRLRGRQPETLTGTVLDAKDQLAIRQAAILQLLELGALGHLRQILAWAAETPLAIDKNLHTALFKVHQRGSFADEKILKKAPDLAIMSFDIERRAGHPARTAFRAASAEEMMITLGDVSLEAGVELDISSWRVSLGLEPIGTEDDPPEPVENPAASALRRQMIDKIERIAREKQLEHRLTLQHRLLFRNILNNKRLFLA